jgi:hypothetical protein
MVSTWTGSHGNWRRNFLSSRHVYNWVPLNRHAAQEYTSLEPWYHTTEWLTGRCITRETDKQNYLCRCFFLLTAANILACTSGLVCRQKAWWKMGKGPPLTHKMAVPYLLLLPICHLNFYLFAILILLPLQLFIYNLVSYRFSLLLQPPILIIHISKSMAIIQTLITQGLCSLHFKLLLHSFHSTVQFLLTPLVLRFHHTYLPYKLLSVDR